MGKQIQARERTRSRIAARRSRILIIDDHPIIQEGFSQLLDRQKDLEPCGVAGDFDEALRQIDVMRPDLILMDVALKQSNGLDLVRTIKARYEDAKILVVSMYDEKLYAERALSAGALGYVNKQEDTRDLLKAIRLALEGKVYLSEQIKERILQRSRGTRQRKDSSPIEQLSDRELEVFELIGTGLTTAEIAERLCLSVHTIDTHRQRIKLKLDLKNAAELAQAAAQWMLEAGQTGQQQA